MKPIFIYITTANEEEAKNISRCLLEQRLIACANYFPIKSMYWWEEKITEDSEFILILKTKEDNYQTIKEEVKKIHSYSVPCITKMNVDPNEEYGQWLNKQIK